MNPSIDELFAQSCGQIRPISLIASLPQANKTSKYHIDKPYAIIGRHAHADISLPYPDVSNQHVYLQVIDGRLFCMDQGSRKWVYWKDRPRLYGWLDAEEWIQVGPFRITLEHPVGELHCRAHGASNTKPVLSKYKATSDTEAQLLLNERQSLPLQSQLTTLGRSRYCNLELEGEHISRVHASIVRTYDGQYWIVDLKSTTGVKINGQRCQSALLNHNDIIAISTYSITFQILNKKERGTPGIEILSTEGKDHSVKESPVKGSEEGVETAASATKAQHQPTLLPDSSKVHSGSSVPELQDHDGESPTHEIARETHLIAAPSSSLNKLKSDLSVPHLASRFDQEASRYLSPENVGLMNGLMQYMKHMQQEMMTQMRMNMEMMAEFMGNMHKQQMQLIREELDQFGKLNKELLELRQSLLTLPPVSDAQEKTIVKQPLGQSESKTEGSDKAPRKWERDVVLQKSDTQTSQQDRTAEKEVPSHQSHLWITRRIAVLEHERQSIWEKMKSAVMGK